MMPVEELRPIVEAVGSVEAFALKVKVKTRTVYNWLAGGNIPAPTEDRIRDIAKKLKRKAKTHEAV